ncbi:MAG: hypothetical protein MZU97_26065 [Bacillus subtilis]|nr:hypothetical protein [Bacillus subtilis]
MKKTFAWFVKDKVFCIRSILRGGVDVLHRAIDRVPRLHQRRRYSSSCSH